MPELVGFAAKFAGFLGISHCSPRFRAYDILYELLLLLEFLARLQPLLADSIHRLFIDDLIEYKARREHD